MWDQSHEHQSEGSVVGAAVWEGQEGIARSTSELTACPSVVAGEALCSFAIPLGSNSGRYHTSRAAGKKKTCRVCSLGAGLFRKSTS